MTTSQRNKYKIAGPQTWELARAAYLAGDSARVVAERFGLTTAAIRRRARKEGWTKRDFAEALEARGIAPPPPPAAPNYVEPEVERAMARQKVDEQRDAEIHAWIEKVAAEEDALDIADALERRALAEASAALVQGRSKDAQALASLAETMRKRSSERASAPVRVRAVQAPLSAADLAASVQAQLREAIAEGRAADAKSLMGIAEQLRKGEEEAQAAESASVAEDDLEQGVVLEGMMEIFGRAAFLAGAMVHEPTSAPAAFVRMIARWRELNLGEGAADAEAAAALVAKARAHHLDGSWLETTPEDVRAYLAARWNEVRKSFP